MTAQPVTDLETKELRRRSRKAKVVAPPPAQARLRLTKPIRRLQRNAPMYAIQGITGLSSRLREITGRDVIDMNRLMGIIHFVYQQRELARRGPDYSVDDFGFPGPKRHRPASLRRRERQRGSPGTGPYDADFIITT